MSYSRLNGLELLRSCAPFPTLKKQLYSPLATGWSCTSLRFHGIGYVSDSAGRKRALSAGQADDLEEHYAHNETLCLQ